MGKLIETALSNTEKRKQYNSIAEKIISMIENGYNTVKIKSAFEKDTEFLEELITIASSRIAVRGKFSQWNRLWLDSYSSSYSTPEYIGLYRSERLANSNIYDLGSGAGLQSIMFAHHSFVTSVEKDIHRCLMEKINSSEYGKDVTVINADVGEFLKVSNIEHDSVIFSDPLRIREQNSPVILEPDPGLLVKKLKDVTGKFVFDLPPLTSVNAIPLEDEAEYISMNGSVVRLTQYSSELAVDQSSAVLFPSGTSFHGKRKDLLFPEEADPQYISIPDPSLVSAKLVYKVESFGKFFLCSNDSRRLVLGSRSQPDHDFPGRIYMPVIKGNLEYAEREIRKKKPSKLYLRYSVNPDSYYDLTNKLNPEPGNGDPLYLFHFMDKYFLCSELS